MNFQIKTFFKAITNYFLLIIIFSLIINILYYYNVISNNTIKYYKMFSLLIISFITGLYIGHNSHEKGYLSGIIFSMVIVVLNLVVALLTKEFSLNVIIYYLITIFIITLSSIVGINRKKM